jgi:hypothetical protein
MVARPVAALPYRKRHTIEQRELWVTRAGNSSFCVFTCMFHFAVRSHGIDSFRHRIDIFRHSMDIRRIIVSRLKTQVVYLTQTLVLGALWK